VLPTFIEQLEPDTDVVQYSGEAETAPGTAADFVAVSPAVDPANDQSVDAVKVVDLLAAT
jgi:hypothetical protein